MTDALTRFRAMVHQAKAESVEPEALDPETSLRLPPHSVEAEQSVIGGLLIDNTAWDRAADTISAGDFYRYEHREIFTATIALINAGMQADVVTVHEAMERSGTAQKTGGMAYLNAMAQSVPSASNIRSYARIVREKSQRRAMITAADHVATVARDESLTVAEGLDCIDRQLDRLRGTQVRKGPAHLSELLVPFIDRVTELHERGVEEVVGMTTGIYPLDRLLSGLQPGKLTVLAARPSIGKSSGARHMAMAAAEAGNTTLVLSMEMPGSEIAACVVSQLGRIDSGRLQRAALDDGDDWGRLSEAVDRGGRMPLYIDDEGGLTLAAIRNKARMVKGLRLLIVDYLQLSTSTLKGATTNDQVAEISKGLKALALSMSISIVLLSQLNREVERRVDKEPILADLRDSGAIEQDADIVVMLWTAREFDDGARRIVGWKVAKHRGGPKGKFAMEFEPAIYRWTESTASLEPPSATARRGSSKGGFE